mmetsp:Transcript_21042/g.60308  ORF Transcript_21042/g.60308 Transcript_21042/m.60308 type:complete len:96 (+) Transcript_21042:881-1168(+)
MLAMRTESPGDDSASDIPADMAEDDLFERRERPSLPPPPETLLFVETPHGPENVDAATAHGRSNSSDTSGRFIILLQQKWGAEPCTWKPDTCTID